MAEHGSVFDDESMGEALTPAGKWKPRLLRHHLRRRPDGFPRRAVSFFGPWPAVALGSGLLPRLRPRPAAGGWRRRCAAVYTRRGRLSRDLRNHAPVGSDRVEAAAVLQAAPLISALTAFAASSSSWNVPK